MWQQAISLFEFGRDRVGHACKGLRARISFIYPMGVESPRLEGVYRLFPTGGGVLVLAVRCPRTASPDGDRQPWLHRDAMQVRH
jgi:hypothetical protein